MRCLVCGWDNSPNSTICLKCGRPLSRVESTPLNQNDYLSSGDDNGANAPRKTVVRNATFNEEQSRPTVAFSNPSEISYRPTSIQNIVKCPHCSYPVAANFTTCPCCGTPLKQVSTASSTEAINKSKAASIDLSDEKIKCQECGEEISVNCTFCPNCGTRVHRPTIRRQIRHTSEAEPEPIPHCSLTIVPEEGEDITPEKNEYEGTSVILNRDNTEKSNRTITSKEQAEIVFEDGHWYLIDRSELQTTYIQATRRIEIIANDILILGDRRFQFNCETSEP